MSIFESLAEQKKFYRLISVLSVIACVLAFVINDKTIGTEE